MNIRQNPYETKSPVQGNDFYDRREILEEAQYVLLGSKTGGIALFIGQRRIGKSSVLMQLSSQLQANGHLAVYFSLDGEGRDPFGVTLKKIAIALYGAVEAQENHKPVLRNPARIRTFDNNGEVFHDQVLSPILTSLEKQKRLCLIFDEFEEMQLAFLYRLDPNSTARKFAATFRRWFDEENRREPGKRLSYAFALGRMTADTDENIGLYGSLLKSSERIRVGSMGQQDTRDMLTDLAREDLIYSDEAIEKIYELSRGHPLLTQTLGAEVYKDVYRDGKGNRVDKSVVTALHVSNHSEEILNTRSDVFGWIWDGFSPPERIYLSVLSSLQDPDQNFVGASQLEDALRSLIPGYSMIESQLKNARDNLKLLETIEGNERIGYRIVVPLFHQWLVINQGTQTVKKEVDKVNPHALEYLEQSKAKKEKKDLDGALFILNGLLLTYPYQSQALIERGLIHLELKNYDLAIDDMNLAYRYDSTNNVVRDSLIQALYTRASITDNDKAKLDDYDRILKISPDNIESKKEHDEILLHRLEALEAEGDFEGALELINNYPDFDKERPQIRIQVLTNLVRQNEERQDWATVSNLCSQLAGLDKVREKEWREKYEESEKRKIYAEQLRIAQDHMEEQEWIDAIEIILGVLKQEKAFILDGKLAAESLRKASSSLYREIEKDLPSRVEPPDTKTRVRDISALVRWLDTPCDSIKDQTPLTVPPELSLGTVVFKQVAQKTPYCLITNNGELNGPLLAVVTTRDINRVISTMSEDAEKPVGSIPKIFDSMPKSHLVSTTDPIRKVFNIFSSSQNLAHVKGEYISVVVVLNRENKAVGTIGYLDILRVIREKKFQNLLDKPAREYMYIPPEKDRIKSGASISDAYPRFYNQNYPAMVVENKDKKFVGLVMAQDILLAFQYVKIDAHEGITINDPKILSRADEMEFIRPELSMKETINAFLHQPYPQTIPVVKSGICVGLISYFDLFRALESCA